MADSSLGAGPDALDETLGRLSKKPGVKAALVLDRESGAILKTSGQINLIRVAKPSGASAAAGAAADAAAAAVAAAPAGAPSFASTDNSEANGSEPPNPEQQAAEEVAAMVWNFVSNAGSLVQELDAEDEVKLLRLRTKKQEFVIVPDPKYLLVVVHDTSA
ncbi:hypothetical protein VTJ83DRAFT_1685 [Remersonia thermophila]|uniref:Roadblock/LAMTOR2 domain-containing protein n=1 Tax=Remersonia thermophila TaxID=72144 RepID=A0ABR4DGV1_9PEZI